MGYRSEVSLTIKNEDFNVFIQNAKQLSQDEEKYKRLYDDIKEIEIRQNEEYTTLYWDWVKWYKDYSEVQFIENFKNDVPHIFYRLGEDDSDYEYTEQVDENDYDMSECVSLVRKLDVEDAGEILKLE